MVWHITAHAVLKATRLGMCVGALPTRESGRDVGRVHQVAIPTGFARLEPPELQRSPIVNAPVIRLLRELDPTGEPDEPPGENIGISSGQVQSQGSHWSFTTP